MKRIVGIVLGLASLFPIAKAAEPPRPTLLVTIVVDQLSADLFNEYRPMYEHGLARLARGAVFPQGYQGHAATETCPGHSTILTGARPARTGIIANDWLDPSRPRTAGNTTTYGIYCVEQAGPANSNSEEKVISPANLRVPTLGDRMKEANRETRVVSVAGKDRSAVMLGGANADLTLWWTREGFATYTGKESAIPSKITNSINKKVRASIADGVRSKLPTQCRSRAQEVSITPNVKVGTLHAIEPGSWRRWRTSAELDAYTVETALEAVKQLQLGKRNTVDLLAVSLSATDYVGHYFGNQGAEMCAQQVALDKTIGRLLKELDKTGVQYVVALTADHGGSDVTERSNSRGLEAAERLDEQLLPPAMNEALTKALGLSEPALLGTYEYSSDVWLSASIPSDKRAEVRDVAARMYRDHRQVAHVFTKDDLLAAPRPTGPVDEWSLLDRAKASFDPERSGDLLVLLKQHVSIYQKPKNGERDYVTTHGSPWGYDRRVPILVWWQGITGFEQPMAVETVDIVPTFASFIGLDIPADQIDGRRLPLPPTQR